MYKNPKPPARLRLATPLSGGQRRKVPRGIAVALNAPLHLQRLRAPGDRHLVHTAVALDAADALRNVHAVIEVRVIGQAVDADPFHRFPGGPALANRREHVEYDLIVTNAFTADARLTSLEVRGRRRRLLSLSGAALAAVTLRAGTSAPTDGRVPPASTVVTQVDLALPRSVGRTVPVFLTNRIKYALPANAPARPVIATTTVKMSALRVDPRPPVVIAAPLRGTGWLNANGCCNDPTSPHRQTLLATSSGGYDTPETFAIDWIRIVNGRQHNGDGSRNTEWPTYGSPLFAVADGTVVFARNNRPDIPPRSSNPDLRTPVDFGGNTVILKIAPGRYACYAHMKPGSVRVRPGQRVRVGHLRIRGDRGRDRR